MVSVGAQSSIFSLLLLWPSITAYAAPPSRGPYFVEASSTAARVCWRIGETRTGDACKRIKNLQPGKEFEYTLPGSKRHWTGRSLPADEGPLRFAVFGDIGSGKKPQYKVASVLDRWDPDLVLITGDIVYPSGKDKHYDKKYFRPYANILPRIPFFPAIGNHDYGNTASAENGEKRFIKHYTKIHRRPKYYSFDAGGAHFISLDVNNEGYNIRAAAPIAPGTDQYKWLEKDLKEKKSQWTFIFLHVPIYASYKHGDHETLQKALTPLISRYGVDVVFAGHNHLYERTKKINGTTYITVGTGGADLNASGGKKPFSIKHFAEYGFVSAVLTRHTLSLEMITHEGKIRDTHVIEKGL